LVTPIDLSTAFDKTDPGNGKGKPYLYTRLGNPNRNALETQISSINKTLFTVACNNVYASYFIISLLVF
jgi:cystathionine beta-lyase/cystathionine gamma-synthase